MQAGPLRTPANFGLSSGVASHHRASGSRRSAWENGQHDIWPWVNYFLAILNAAYNEFESRVGTVAVGRGSKAERIKQHIRCATSDVFTFEDLARALPDISTDHIRSEVRKLAKAGAVHSPGSGRKQWKRLSADF